MAVRVATIIYRKGSEVVTIAPDANLGAAAELMVRHGIGALVVSRDGRAVEGMLSERDLAGHLARDGARAPEVLVAAAMTTGLVTCSLETTTDELAAMMTERRVRHVPVIEHGGLVALVSIGDVVKSRMDELAAEREQLQAYVSGTY